MKLKRCLAITVAICLSCAPAARSAEQSVRLGEMNVTAWSGGPVSDARQPVIMFSHGFHGCATQSRFLMEALASEGYLVFAPNHRDATCGGGKSRWTERSAVPFRQPETWSESSFRDRAEDIRRLIDAIKADDRFQARADWSRLGLAGHSLGGYTALGLGGAWKSWKIPGIKAILALSPYSQPFLSHRTLGGLSAPVMYQGGTLDFGITPALNKSSGSFDQSPEPKYFVEFDRAGHLAWADVGRAAHDGIVAYSIAFLNHYVKGEPAKPLLTKSSPGVARFRYASELGNNSKDEGARR